MYTYTKRCIVQNKCSLLRLYNSYITDIVLVTKLSALVIIIRIQNPSPKAVLEGRNKYECGESLLD